jgi:tRNA-binding protein
MTTPSDFANPQPQTTTDTFFACDIRVGTVLAVRVNDKARKPALVVEVDFGPLGTKTTSAQIRDLYEGDVLVGRQIVGVVNFAPRNVAGVHSEFLILGACADNEPIVLLHPEQPVANGTRVA